MFFILICPSEIVHLYGDVGKILGGVTQKGPFCPESVSYQKKDLLRVAAPALLLV